MSKERFLPGHTGKMIYVSQKEARNHIFRGFKNRKGYVHEYKCRYWDHWHLTSIPKGQYKKRVKV